MKNSTTPFRTCPKCGYSIISEKHQKKYKKLQDVYWKEFYSIRNKIQEKYELLHNDIDIQEEKELKPFKDELNRKLNESKNKCLQEIKDLEKKRK